jgi:hypothetical protein
MADTLEDFASADMFYSGDVDDRMKELRDLLEDETEGSVITEFQDELDKLEEFKSDVSSGEWKYGMAFIADEHFEDYARQMAEDIGAISSSNGGWPMDYIDWERAADALKMDYSSVELDGNTFWYR